MSIFPMGFDDNNNRTTPGRHGASAPRGGSRTYGQGSAPRPAAPQGGRPYPQGTGYAPRPTGPSNHASYPGQQPANFGYPAQGDEIVRVRKKRKKHRKLKRAALIALVGSVVAYGAWYTGTLSSNMALDAQEKTELDNVLAPVDTQMQPFYVLLVGSDN